MSKEKVLIKEKKDSFRSLIDIRFILLTFVFLTLTFLLLSLVTAASSYVRSAPAYTFGHQTASYTGGQLFTSFDRSMCQAGQDFILQVDPLGCTPSVIRSDLLEEQEVVVFCPISATQLNPLIKIKDIDYMTITSKNLPREVLTVGYYPARAALGKWDPDINTPYLDNIGYATIVLRRQPNESAMPDFVQGNLTARLVYDIDNAFGTGRAVYHLPQLTDDEWNNGYAAYGFWDGRGYLRLESLDNTGATIGVYSDRDATGTGRLGEKTRLTTLNLEKGEKSQQVYLPGFNYCMGGIEIQLNDLENPDTRAKLRIDSDILEVGQGEKFLENKCVVKTITKQGINQKVEISCQEDEKRGNIPPLRINPKINLSIDAKKEYGVGDFLYDNGDKSVYLGFIGNSGKTDSVSDLYIRIISIPKPIGVAKEILSESEISYVADYDRCLKGSDIKKAVSGKTSELDTLQCLKIIPKLGGNYLEGKELNHLHYSAPSDTKIFGKNLDITGYAGVNDADLSQMPKEVLDNYHKAIEDYETIKKDFSEDRYPPNDVKTLGEDALREAIKLSNHLGQMGNVSRLCREFSENYDSVVDICNNELLLSSTQISGQSVIINGKTHIISFEGVREPSFDEFGLEIVVRSSGGEKGYSLYKNELVHINDVSNEYIQLIDLEEDSATLKTSLLGTTQRTIVITSAPLTSSTHKLKTGTEETFDSRYGFRIKKINLQKVAKVTINPQVDYARTNATINFKIGIEKRAIQLSPEKTKERIETLNETIQKWTKISNGLGKVVEMGKAACLATAGALTIKNFFLNLGGKGIARQTVMKASGVGWYDKCQVMVKPNGPYDNVEACLLNKSDEIDASVNAYGAAMKQQNDEIKNLEEGISDTRFLGEKVVNTDALTGKLMADSVFISDINSCKNKVQIIVGGKTINAVDISPINSDTTSLTQARNLQLNCRLLSSSDTDVQAIAKSNVEKTFGEIYSNSEARAAKDSAINQFSNTGIKDADVYVSGNKITSYYRGDVTSQSLGNLPSGVPAKIIVFDNINYIVQLEKVGTNSYKIANVFDASGKTQSSEIVNEINKRFVFETTDSKTYSNTYTNPQVRYYETDPYKGFPSVIPFDIKNGWYAAVKSNLPVLGGLKSYDDSGRVSSFYVCNVGQNGREENIGGDDICRGFVPGTSQSPDFPGLNSDQSSDKMKQAERAIQQAQTQYKTGVKRITGTCIQGPCTIDVGEPAANIPGILCEDFMSPSDCNIMFNVCDPFICPSSRCNLGGAYPVKDVIQSGIAGSLALCLPNWPEVKVPICVSGVNAGLEGYLSVLSSYQQCLQTSLDTGQTVGICDELNSIYMCEFFWKQGLPLIKYAIPKVIGSVLGQNVRGGGEYLGVSDAMSNAEKSIDYFSQYYAANSFAAFKARSVESVGGEICRNWVSLTGPKGNLFDALIAPDSPSQFYGRFEELPYTTATNPPVSQYKVFYHIYAGKDLPSYYQVYLQGTGGSFYQDTDFRRPVAAGFIKTGDFKSETIDFTAPSGYKELCIVVNGQEECGFKQVTTEFGINYLSEQYASQQSKQNASSEAECVSGSPSAFSFLNPNLQAGAEEALNPAIYNRGIIRVCSTENPGKTSDPSIKTENQRWKEVGNCGSQNLRCWLDTDSVKDVIKNANIENQTLFAVGDKERQYIDALTKEGKYLADFDSFKKELDELSGQDSQLITKVNENIGKVYQNNQKAYLYLKRGNAYGNLAIVMYNVLKKDITVETEDASIPTTLIPPATGTEETSLEEQAEAKRCDNECGFYCTKAECESLGCTFVDRDSIGRFTLLNECIPKEKTTTSESLKCSTLEGCQKVLGERIIKLAIKKKETAAQKQTISIDAFDSSVKADTGAKSFECLVLQVAFVESSIKHCIKPQENGDPLYCDGIQSSVLGGDAESGSSKGVMQINIAAHPDAFSKVPSVYSFEENVNYGINLLVNHYNDPASGPSKEKIYRCYRAETSGIVLGTTPVTGDFNPAFYSGWRRAMRTYNGWNTDCYKRNEDGTLYKNKDGNLEARGNPWYVDSITKDETKNYIAGLFPECA